MSDEQTKAAAEKYSEVYIPMVRNTSVESFIAGAAYRDEGVRELVETLKDVIRNSSDIIAKKYCSEALSKFKGEI